jgi:hypothetical protein
MRRPEQVQIEVSRAEMESILRARGERIEFHRELLAGRQAIEFADGRCFVVVGERAPAPRQLGPQTKLAHAAIQKMNTERDAKALGIALPPVAAEPQTAQPDTGDAAAAIMAERRGKKLTPPAAPAAAPSPASTAPTVGPCMQVANESIALLNRMRTDAALKALQRRVTPVFPTSETN